MADVAGPVTSLAGPGPGGRTAGGGAGGPAARLTGDLLLVGVVLDGARVDVRCAGGRDPDDRRRGLVPRSGETGRAGSGRRAPRVSTTITSTCWPWRPATARSTLVRSGWRGRTTPAGAATVGRRRLAPGAWAPGRGLPRADGGPLDRWALDAAGAGPSGAGPAPLRSPVGPELGRPVRALGTRRRSGRPAGVERDGRVGRPVGCSTPTRWLADRLPRRRPPDLGAGEPASGLLRGHRCHRRHTDPPPGGPGGRWHAPGGPAALVQRVRVMGAVGRDDRSGPPDGLEVGPVKVMVPDGGPADVGALAERIGRAHRAVGPWRSTASRWWVPPWPWPRGTPAGVRSGDRMEHGAVLTPEWWTAGPAGRHRRDPARLRLGPRGRLRWRKSTRTSSPISTGAVHWSGQACRWAEVRTPRSVRRTPGWRCPPRSVGRPARGAPWALTNGSTPSGPSRLFLAPPDRPGGAARAVRVGSPADFCLLDDDLPRALVDPGSHHVVATVVGGRAVYEA